MKSNELPAAPARVGNPGGFGRKVYLHTVRRLVDRFIYPAEKPVVNISISMALSMAGSFLLMRPSSWVYRATRQKKGFDQQVVQTFIILAVAVAGVIIIARNSVALAFSLAGVVGAVRFRNTLPETRDSLYVFLAIGVGLAAGVDALTAALCSRRSSISSSSRWNG